jgi:hypothetical protein
MMHFRGVIFFFLWIGAASVFWHVKGENPIRFWVPLDERPEYQTRYNADGTVIPAWAMPRGGFSGARLGGGLRGF